MTGIKREKDFTDQEISKTSQLLEMQLKDNDIIKDTLRNQEEKCQLMKEEKQALE